MLNKKFPRLSLSFIRYQTNIARDNNKYKSSTEEPNHNRHLANINVTSFYCQNAIEQLTRKVLF